MINELGKKSRKGIIKSIFKVIMYWAVWVVLPVVVADLIISYNNEMEPSLLEDKIIISVLLVFTIIFLVVIVIKLVRLMGGLYKKNYMKAIDKALKTMTMEEIEEDYRLAENYGPSLKIGSKFTWFLKSSKEMVMLMNEDFVWAYENIDELKYSAYGIFTYFTIKKQYLMLVDRQNYMYSVRMKNMEIKNALTQYAVCCKYILNGYDEELERMRVKDFGRMVNMVDQRKREQKEREIAIQTYNRPKVDTTKSAKGFSLKL